MTKNIFTSNANLIKINHQPPSERNNYFSQSKISIVFQASQVILSEIKNTFSSQLHSQHTETNVESLWPYLVTNTWDDPGAGGSHNNNYS